ncbi:MAG TPA: SPFH domain-containing protein [Polyangiaceae bacterium]|jgi:membrane protease subunit (stomatin/prohibitin family)|nr:SPFH domain-containing protein [Polyangiaceae bacterium]
MGIFDFVKGGVQRMMIARPDTAKEAIVYKHPDQNFPFWSQLTVDSDELVLFFKDGAYVGYLGPGRHTLDTQNIPFLGSLVDKFTGGNVFISELYFVTTRPLYNQTFGGPIGSMRDPELDIRVNPRAFGTYSFRVVDALKFVTEFVGQTGAADPDRAMQWVRDQLMMGVKATLARLIKEGEMTMMDFGTAGADVARAIVQSCPDLTRIGVTVLEIAKLNLNLSDEDQARIDQFQDQIVQAKINARKAKIGVSQAEAEMEAQKFRDDRQFQNRAQYVNNLDLNRYQQFAGAEAMLGVGAGMAKGGEGGGAPAALAGAGLVAGLGMGAGMQYGMHPGYGPPGFAPPGYGPPGYPGQAPGYPPGQAPGYPPAGYAAGPQQGYPQQPYPQQGYPQQPYPQQPFPQQGYPQGAAQPGAPQQGYPQQGYAPQGAPAVPATPPAAPPVAPTAAAQAAAPGACGKCGAANPAGARFCAECGNGLKPGS